MKNFFLTAFIILFQPAFVYSQADIALKYAETISQKDLKKQLTVLASAAMEGRETGTEGQRKAADYIETQFKDFGLNAPDALKGYKQYFSIFKDTLEPKELRIGKQELDYGKNYVLLSGSSVKEPFQAKEIVFAGYGIEEKFYNDYAGKNVKGKVVLILSGEPEIKNKKLSGADLVNETEPYGMEKKSLAAKHRGAVAALFINTDWDSIPSAKAENADKIFEYSTENNKPAAITMVLMSVSEFKNLLGEDIADKIIADAKAQKLLNNIKIHKKIKTKLIFEKSRVIANASNVIGFVEGSDKKDEYIFLTAHYDHLGKIRSDIYYGADDNASGTSGVLEMAEAFAQAKKDGHGPRRTIVFMTVSGEEEGLLGSKFFTDHSVFPLDKISVDLNIDMIGRTDPNRGYKTRDYLYSIGSNKLSSELVPICDEVNEKYTKLKIDYKYNFNDPSFLFYRSDQYNFAKKDVPVIFFTSGLHRDYHKTSDTVDKINFVVMEKRIRFVFLCAWEMANGNEMIKRDKPRLK